MTEENQQNENTNTIKLVFYFFLKFVPILALHFILIINVFLLTMLLIMLAMEIQDLELFEIDSSMLCWFVCLKIWIFRILKCLHYFFYLFLLIFKFRFVFHFPIIQIFLYSSEE